MDNNPFLALADTAPKVPPCGDPNCTKKHRLNGEHYAADKSTMMTQLNEDGKAGGKAFGVLGGAKATRRRRATEIVAESAAEQAERIKQVFIDGIDESNPIGVRLQAAKEFLKVEADDIQRDMEERKAEFDAMNKDQLVGSITTMLERLGAAGQIAAEVDAMVEAEVVDED